MIQENGKLIEAVDNNWEMLVNVEGFNLKFTKVVRSASVRFGLQPVH